MKCTGFLFEDEHIITDDDSDVIQPAFGQFSHYAYFRF